jgi:hypothetical protein
MKSLGQAAPSEQHGHALAQQNLDGLLGAYFQAQLPETWPEAKSATELSSVAWGMGVRSRTRIRNRLVLAASLVFLLLGQFFLSGMFTGLPAVRSDRDLGKMEATKRTGEMRLKPAVPSPR